MVIIRVVVFKIRRGVTIVAVVDARGYMGF
jgi:hypothetical protein